MSTNIGSGFSPNPSTISPGVAPSIASSGSIKAQAQVRKAFQDCIDTMMRSIWDSALQRYYTNQLTQSEGIFQNFLSLKIQLLEALTNPALASTVSEVFRKFQYAKADLNAEASQILDRVDQQVTFKPDLPIHQDYNDRENARMAKMTEVDLCQPTIRGAITSLAIDLKSIEWVTPEEAAIFKSSGLN